jgi:two-component system, LytTR family, sensor kinase
MRQQNTITGSYQNKDFLLSILTARKFRIIRHGLFLLLFALLFIGSLGQKDYKGVYQVLVNGIFAVSMVMCFYINMYVLIPKTLYIYKYTRYLLYLIILVTATFAILLFVGEWLFAPFRLKPIDGVSIYVRALVSVLFLVFLILPSTALKVFQRWVADSGRIHELERMAMTSELKALKNQINPHFLFNMLNNVNVLISTDPEKAQFVIHQLSGFLRYYLYENSDDAVFLPVEINFITDFLNIEKLRRDDFDFKIVNRSLPTSGIKVPSNLLMTFVENAIKHGANPGGYHRIRIAITATDSHIIFSALNSKPRVQRISRVPGLGLANALRRLDLQYQGRHRLEVQDLNAVYKVTLKLPL